MFRLIQDAKDKFLGVCVCVCGDFTENDSLDFGMHEATVTNDFKVSQTLSH